MLVCVPIEMTMIPSVSCRTAVTFAMQQTPKYRMCLLTGTLAAADPTVSSSRHMYPSDLKYLIVVVSWEPRDLLDDPYFNATKFDPTLL